MSIVLSISHITYIYNTMFGLGGWTEFGENDAGGDGTAVVVL